MQGSSLSAQEWIKFFDAKEKTEDDEVIAGSSPVQTKKKRAKAITAKRSKSISSQPLKGSINLANFTVKQIASLFSVVKESIKAKIVRTCHPDECKTTLQEFERKFLIHGICKGTVSEYIQEMLKWFPQRFYYSTVIDENE